MGSELVVVARHEVPKQSLGLVSLWHSCLFRSSFPRGRFYLLLKTMLGTHKSDSASLFLS